ncbi:hypothetical protein UCRNP2_6202 [Neofusicoccum parvum UCRNP2]|uniref:Uncharacterized protein n=1 Tax=Botryosphaeria parva (strain UCR-NP2) TaxID=1287680 RepID=R1GFM6_BOTPV|nr:hypothetical protein UCRNP2_6202 [Neofusicoccum parvum UCRNP2]
MWGRGGAGNIQQGAQLAEASKQRAAEDPESANPPGGASPPPGPATSQPQEYAHMGRGGAGNFYSPAELASTGRFDSSGTATTTTAEPPPQPLENLDSSSGWWNTATGPAPAAKGDAQQQQEQIETPIARTGRGGAGNFVWGGGSERRAEQIRKEWGELREAQRNVAEKVEEDVEKALPKPGKAWLGGGKVADERPN